MKLAEIKPQTFENVTFYTTNFFGIGRVDCKSLEIREGYDYAQYPNAVHVQFLEKGKRKPKAIVISSLPFFILVDTKHAIKPDDWMNHNVDGSGESKYASFDERYQTDFRAKLEGAKTPIIKDYANWNAYQNAYPAK